MPSHLPVALRRTVAVAPGLQPLGDHPTTLSMADPVARHSHVPCVPMGRAVIRRPKAAHAHEAIPGDSTRWRTHGSSPSRTRRLSMQAIGLPGTPQVVRRPSLCTERTGRRSVYRVWIYGTVAICAAQRMARGVNGARRHYRGCRLWAGRVRWD